MMESIEKLREIARDSYQHNGLADMYALADEIEREIAERYMELPLDADGVPIRIGDTVREADDRVPMEVMSLTFYKDCADVNACGMNPNLLRHVKPRTIEDVLEEFVHEWNDTHSDDMPALKARYADELRGMGVGE